MATHSSVLAWRIPGMGEPDGLPSMGSKRVGHDWSNLAAAAASYSTHTTPAEFNCKRMWISTGRNHKGILKSICYTHESVFLSVQFCSVIQACLTLCNPMNCKTSGLPVHHQLPEFTQTHDHWVSDAIQPSHPLSSPSPPAFSVSQHQSFFNESTLPIRWPKYWSFNFNISPSNEHPALISFNTSVQ